MAASSDYDMEESLAAAREITKSRRAAGATGFYGATEDLHPEAVAFSQNLARGSSPIGRTEAGYDGNKIPVDIGMSPGNGSISAPATGATAADTQHGERTTARQLTHLSEQAF